MPDERTQYYIVKVSRMTTSDDADLVSSWSAVIAEEKLGDVSLPTAARVTAMALEDAPVENIRPMTLDEIEAWRKGEANG